MTKEPKFTDTQRFPVPYVPAVATDIRKTFERVVAQTRDAWKNNNHQPK